MNLNCRRIVDDDGGTTCIYEGDSHLFSSFIFPTLEYTSYANEYKLSFLCAYDCEALHG